MMKCTCTGGLITPFYNVILTTKFTQVSTEY